jgi:acyl-homoserine lactone acylase PvdQ
VRIRLAGAAGLLVLLTMLGSAGAAPRLDYAATALNVLPPGESGSLSLPKNATDQLPLYDGLTPLRGSVKPADLNRYFKPEPLGLGKEKVVRTEDTGRLGLRLVRDRWGVAHVFGKTRADVEFGAGWVAGEDRQILMELLRGPGRIAALDVPGQNAFRLALGFRAFVPSAATESFLHDQLKLVEQAGPKGRLLLADVRNYVAGINAYYKFAELPIAPWTPEDVIAVGSLLGADLGVGGGDESFRSEFLSALAGRLGKTSGREVFDDLRQQQDPETPVSVDGTFAYPSAAPSDAGNAVLDDGSFTPTGGGSDAARASPIAMSNALLISAKRSLTGHPLMVAGPQVGYTYPEILLEEDLHGGGIDARGASFPGLSFYVLLGRAKDYAWSATSANSDIVDHYVETLCGDDTHYRYQGSCREMGTFDAGLLKGKGTIPDHELVFRTTVHGPVIGYATVGGQRVAVSSKRSTRGRELLSAVAFQDLNENKAVSARSFFQVMNQMEFTFNWFYVDSKDIAMFSSGRLPVRAAGVDGGLPTIGTGEFEWKGFVPASGHAQGIDPKDGAIVNWNNKPARGFSSSDDNWSYGPVQRVDMLRAGIAARKKHSLTSVVAAMNAAATQDFRAVAVLPVIEDVLRGSTAPSARDQQLLNLLESWRQAGSSRLDVNLDGKIDDPGAAIMDAAWPKLADAVLSPVLGPLTDRLAQLMARDDRANSNGSSYFGGWYSYVVKDLRSLLGKPVTGAWKTRFCGAGDLGACRVSLWAALDAAGNELATTQGADPAAWRADATRERISFGFLPATMRWANRPTFQQVISFNGHR